MFGLLSLSSTLESKALFSLFLIARAFLVNSLNTDLDMTIVDFETCVVSSSLAPLKKAFMRLPLSSLEAESLLALKS